MIGRESIRETSTFRYFILESMIMYGGERREVRLVDDGQVVPSIDDQSLAVTYHRYLRMSSMLVREPKERFLTGEDDDDELDPEGHMAFDGLKQKEQGTPARVCGSEVLQGQIKNLCEKFKEIFATGLAEAPAGVTPYGLRVETQKWRVSGNRTPVRQLGSTSELELKIQIV